MVGGVNHAFSMESKEFYSLFFFPLTLVIRVYQANLTKNRNTMVNKAIVSLYSLQLILVHVLKFNKIWLKSLAVTVRICFDTTTTITTTLLCILFQVLGVDHMKQEDNYVESSTRIISLPSFLQTNMSSLNIRIFSYYFHSYILQ